MFLLYLDPGSGSILLQLLIAAGAGIALFVGSQWKKIKRWFNRNKPPVEAPSEEDEDDA